MTAELWQSGPFIVYWNITSKCNLNCKHCHAIRNGNDDLTSTQYKEVIEKLALSDVKIIIIAGGEPLLIEKIWEILGTIKSFGIRAYLITNGYYLNQNTITLLVETKVDGIQVSLDSPYPEVHDRFRGIDGSFYKAINAIEICKEHSVNVSVNTVIMPENINDLEIMGEKLKELGIANWRLTINVPKGRGKQEYDKLQISDSTIIDKINRVKKTYSHVLVDDPLCVKYWGTDDTIAKQCGAGKIICAIEANGDIKPCIFIEDKFGNILESDLMKVWNSKEMQCFRESETNNPECKKCEAFTKCKGGCKAFRSYFESQREMEKFCFGSSVYRANIKNE